MADKYNAGNIVIDSKCKTFFLFWTYDLPSSMCRVLLRVVCCSRVITTIVISFTVSNI